MLARFGAVIELPARPVVSDSLDAMRKLVIVANVLLREGRVWTAHASPAGRCS